ncbi:unnamed protein product [Ectocarpus fasciculatus]
MFDILLLSLSKSESFSARERSIHHAKMYSHLTSSPKKLDCWNAIAATTTTTTVCENALNNRQVPKRVEQPKEKNLLARPAILHTSAYKPSNPFP